MLSRITHEGNTTMELDLGEHAGPLPNMREITEGDVAKSDMFVYTPDYIGYRQIHQFDKLKECGITPPSSNGQEHMMAVKFFVFHDKRGIAMYGDYWGGKIRWFSFAVCEHDFTETKIGNCLHEYACKKCKYRKSVDSSG